MRSLQWYKRGAAYRWFSTGGEDKALMIRQHHPSRSYSWCEWTKVFQDLFKN